MASVKSTKWFNPSVNRRTFLKVSGTLATAAAISPVFTKSKPASAAPVTGMLNTGENPPDPVETAENIIYSVCQMCHSRCGVRAKVVDGILVKRDRFYGYTKCQIKICCQHELFFYHGGEVSINDQGRQSLPESIAVQVNVAERLPPLGFQRVCPGQKTGIGQSLFVHVQGKILMQQDLLPFFLFFCS